MHRSLRWPALAAFLIACSVYEQPTENSIALGGSGFGGSGAEAGKTSSSGGDNASIAGTTTGGTAVGGKEAGAAGSAGSVSGGMPNAGTGGSGVAEPMAGASDGGGGGVTEPDACPGDPDKTAPGVCGCGIPDVSTATMTDCKTLKAKLAHRYDFEGSGTSVKDRIGTAHGSIARSATLSKLNGKGVVLLGGGSGGPYVDLPNGLLSTLSNATLEAWVTWGGGSNWQRVFDFGDSTYVPPENNPENGKTYLYLTPKNINGVVQGGFSTDGNSAGQETQITAAAALPLDLAHVALVADDKGDKLRMYINGAKVAEKAWTGKLSTINDVNVWLGRSQYGGDDELSAVFHEFRVYGVALTDADIATSYAGGPDPDFLAY